MSKSGRKIKNDTEALALQNGWRVGMSGHDIATTYLIDRLTGIALEPFKGISFELRFHGTTNLALWTEC